MKRASSAERNAHGVTFVDNAANEQHVRLLEETPEEETARKMSQWSRKQSTFSSQTEEEKVCQFSVKGERCNKFEFRAYM